MENKIAKIEEITSINGVSVETKELINAAFNPFAAQINEWKELVAKLKVTSVEQVDEMKQARDGRLALQKVRTGADKKRKELKEESNKYNKAVQEVYNWIESEIKPMEEYLELQEKFKEVQEAKMKAERLIERQKELAQWDYSDTFTDLLNMPEDTYSTFKIGVEGAYNARIESERKAEEARIAEENAKIARRERFEKRNNELSIYWATMKTFPDNSNFNYTDATEEEYQVFLEAAKKDKSDFEAKQEEQRIENERLKAEAKEKEILHAKRSAEMRPYMVLIRDWNGMINMPEEEYQQLLSDIKRGESERIDFEKKQEAKREQEAKKRGEKIVNHLKECGYAETVGGYSSGEHFIGEHHYMFTGNDAEMNQVIEGINKQVELVKMRLELKLEKERQEKEQKEKEQAKKEADKLAKAPVKNQLTAWVNSFELPSTSVDNELSKSIIAKFEAYKNWAKSEIEKL